MRPVHQRHRERSGGGKLPRCRQTSHRGALSGAGVHLQVGGEAVEPGTAHSIHINWRMKVRGQFSESVDIFTEQIPQNDQKM